MAELLITCEHGGRDVPAQYAHLFRGQQRVLASHRGYDPGALELARAFAGRLEAPLIFSTVTRLLVELNRSPTHRQVFSEFTRQLDAASRQTLLLEHYHPYRRQVEDWICQRVNHRHCVLYLSVHTFTPVFNGQPRSADIGLLYDPARLGERQFCQFWRTCLRQRRPDLRVRRNYPYLGKADGLTTWLRRQFAEHQYIGLELEVSQCWPKRGEQWRQLQQDLVHSFAEAIKAFHR